MTTCLGKSCSFGLPRVSFVNCCHFMYLVISFLVLRAGCGICLYRFLIIAYLFTLLNIRICQPENWCSPRRSRGEHHFRELINPDVNLKRMHQLFCCMNFLLVCLLIRSANCHMDFCGSPVMRTTVCLSFNKIRRWPLVTLCFGSG